MNYERVRRQTENVEIPALTVTQHGLSVVDFDALTSRRMPILHDASLEASLAADLALAHQLADAADDVSMRRFGASDLVVTSKPDMTPVSDADKTVEEIVRKRIGRNNASDSIIGEEFGVSGDSSREWIIDPIDGTKNFVRGVPVWATLIGLRISGLAPERGDMVLGMISAPALGRRWWSAMGGGAWLGPNSAGGAEGKRIGVSAVNKLADASLSYSNLMGWQDAGRLPEFLKLVEVVWRTRGYGDFWSHCMVAEGVTDISTEPSVALWDLAAVSALVSEAGGRFTGLDGVAGPAQSSAVASNGALHQEVLSIIGD
jgi:histidinol-phosphatase